MRVECLDGTLLLRPNKTEKTKGGVLLPDGTHIAEVGQLTVVKAGPGYYTQGGEWFAMDLDEGQQVLLMPSAPVTPYDYEGERCVFVDRMYVLAVLREDGLGGDVEDN